MECKKVNIGKGFVDIYDFGKMKLHCYQTNDLMSDESYILENNEAVLLVEFPAFYDNLEDFKNNVKKEYPNYSGLNYLDMTAGFFFSEN